MLGENKCPLNFQQSVQDERKHNIRRISVTNFFLHKSNFGMFKAACLFKSTKYLARQALLYHESKYSYTAVSVIAFSANLICQYLDLYDPEQDIRQYF